MPEYLNGITVKVVYEMFDGVPSFDKWVEVSGGNESSGLRIDNVIVEDLALNDEFGPGFAAAESGFPLSQIPLMHGSVDVAHGAACGFSNEAEGTWSHQTRLTCAYSVVGAGNTYCHPYANPPEVCPSTGEACPKCGESTCTCPPLKTAGQGISVRLESSSALDGVPCCVFKSFRANVVLFDSLDRERRGFIQRRLVRIKTPQTQENPIFFHLSDGSPQAFRKAVDQLQSVGFEMLIFSFWSGFSLESKNATYLQEIADDVQYAKSKGIEVGGYDLICLDRADTNFSAVSPTTGKEVGSACFASGWVDYLQSLIDSFLEKTGMTMIETDGPFGGEPCASTSHAFHEGLHDSVYAQEKLQSQMYKIFKSKGVYIHSPDFYFGSGANKIMNYADPAVFGLPRAADVLITRQMLFDSTFSFVPTQQWSFLPLENYASAASDAAARFSPVGSNLQDYDNALMGFFGYGINACYRGTQLFDDDSSKELVSKRVAWYKKYRHFLGLGDVVHVKRPNGQTLDAILRTNPHSKKGDILRGILIVHNPTQNDLVNEPLTIDLYYTAIETDNVVFDEQAKGTKESRTNLSLGKRNFKVTMLVSMVANSATWYTVEQKV